MSNFTLDKFKVNKHPSEPKVQSRSSNFSGSSPRKAQSNSSDLDPEFEVVPKDKWSLIPVGSYIKWMNENNKITIGGFVLAHRYSQENKIRKILMCKFFGQTIDRNLNPSWEIKLNQVKQIWKKKPTLYETRVEKIEKDIHNIIKLLHFFNEEIKKLKSK